MPTQIENGPKRLDLRCGLAAPSPVIILPEISHRLTASLNHGFAVIFAGYSKFTKQGRQPKSYQQSSDALAAKLISQSSLSTQDFLIEIPNYPAITPTLKTSLQTHWQPDTHLAPGKISNQTALNSGFLPIPLAI